MAFAQRAVHHAGQHDHAAIGIEPGIENQRLQRCFGIALGRRQAMHDRFEHIGHAQSCFRADQHRVVGVEANGLLDHLFGALHISAGQVDLVDDGNDIEAVD